VNLKRTLWGMASAVIAVVLIGGTIFTVFRLWPAEEEDFIDSPPTPIPTQEAGLGLGEALARIDPDALYAGLLQLYADLHPTPTPTPAPPPAPVVGASSATSSTGVVSIRIRPDEPAVRVVGLGIDSSGAMETPSGVWEAAWYNFSSRPGQGGNAVFSGHVDALFTGDPGPAAFYSLKDLDEGDIIEVTMANGTVYKYAVSSKWSVDPNNADVGSIVGRTPNEVITLITCGGDSGTAYYLRHIVRAKRI